jgi:chromosome segregation ATPase
MTGPNNPRASHAQFVDAVFARVGGEQRDARPAATNAVGVLMAGPTAVQQGATRRPLPDPAQTAVPAAQSGDPRSEYEWIGEERRRLEAYTLQQFAQIKQQREDFIRQRSQIEEAVALKGQELNRQMKLNAAQTEALQRREKELAEREAGVAGQEERLAGARQELADLRQAGRDLQAEVGAQRLILEQQRGESAQLSDSIRTARTELIAYEEALQYRKKAWQDEQAELSARQTQLDQRFGALDQAEAALDRRTAELVELEGQLRTEIEEQERRLAEEYRQMESLRSQFRR